MKKIKATDPELVKVIRTLRKKSQENKAKIWRDVADRLARSRQRRATVNLSQLNRHTKDGETVVIPGKVLSSGKLEHPLKVAAFTFSKQAESKIMGAKGICLSIQDLVEKNPKGTNVRIIE